MKQGWEIKKLGEVATIVGGSTPKTNDFANWGGSNYWVTPAELTGNKWISSTERTITDLGVKNAHLQILPVGTVLLSSRAPIGKVAITTVEMYCNQGFKNIVCSKNILNEFVYWFLFHNTDYLNSLGTGATFKEISKRVVEQIPIPVPERAEQERIVGELDCLSGIIAAKRAQLRELDTLAQSIFYTMFGDPITNDKGWQTKALGDVARIINGYAFDSKLFSTDKNDMPLIRIRDIKKGYTETFYKGKYPNTYIIKNGDYIIGMDGEFNIVEWRGGTALLNQRVCKIEFIDDEVIGRYALRFLSIELKRIEDATSFVTVKHLSSKSLISIFIPIPPIDLQQHFAEKIENIERQKELITKSIKETEDLFNSRMDYYFN